MERRQEEEKGGQGDRLWEDKTPAKYKKTTTMKIVTQQTGPDIITDNT